MLIRLLPIGLVLIRILPIGLVLIRLLPMILLLIIRRTFLGDICNEPLIIAVSQYRTRVLSGPPILEWPVFQPGQPYLPTQASPEGQATLKFGGGGILDASTVVL